MRQIKKGSTNKSVDLYIIDSTDGTPETGVVWNTSGIDLKYRREGAAAVSITEATLALLTTAHADGGFLTIGFGSYRFDVPDAAWATGAETVTIFGTVTGMIVLPVVIQLVDNIEKDIYDIVNHASYGNAKLVRATTPANTLKVDANNRAEVLLGAVTHTGAVVPTVSTLTGKTGFSLSTAGILAIWHQLTSGISTAGSIGKLLKDEITSARMAELDPANLPARTDGIQTDLDNATDGLGALKALIDAVNTDLSNGTDGLGALKTLIDAILLDTGTSLPASLAAIIAYVDELESRLTAARAGYLDNLNGHTPQTGDHTSAIAAIPTTKTGYSLSTAGILAIWHQLTSAIATAGSIGKLFKDEITSARMAELDPANLPARTDGIQTDLNNATDGLGALKALIDAVNTDLSNGTDGLGALKMLLDAIKAESDKISTTAITESYAADGAAATLTQLSYMIWSMLNSLKFAGTTGTSRKLDGSTAAMTFTIDDANNPTDIKRTT